MKIKARAKYIRISPRKMVRLVRLIRGKPIAEARNTLKFLPQFGAKAVAKVLNSAIANAVNNYHLKEENLSVAEAEVEVGSTFKRYKPRARGRMDVILKRSCHITVVLKSKEEK